MFSKIAVIPKPTKNLVKNYQVTADLEVVGIAEVELGCGHTVSVKTIRDATFRKQAEAENLLKKSYHGFNFVIYKARHEIPQPQ